MLTTCAYKSRAMLLAAAAVLAGCGSSAGSSSGTAPTASGFIAQLNAACRADVAGLRVAPKTVAAEAVVQRKFIQKLRTLTPTAPLRATFHEYVSVLEQDLAAFDRHQLTTEKQLKAQLAAVLAKLRQAGATAC